MWRKVNSHTLLVESKLAQPLWKTICRLLKKLKLGMPYDLAIPLLGPNPEEIHKSQEMKSH
jgi:hypothetical protein